MRRIFTFLLFLALFSFPFLLPYDEVLAQSYEVKYDFDFTLNESHDIDTKLTITLMNLRPDLYINEFSLTFPTSFFSSSFEVKDEQGNDIPYTISPYKSTTKVTFTFNEPVSGKFSENRILLSYKHKGLHSFHNDASEVILPLVLPKENIQINATLNLPVVFDKKLSISKPKPTSVEFNRIHWEDISVRTIYALFGDSQGYDVNLRYHLSNNGITDAAQSITLPPDTLYQKTVIKSLDPEPDRVSIDEDGNYLAFYEVKRKQEKAINYQGYITIFAHPREEMKEYVAQHFQSQKKYLLSEQKYWGLGAAFTEPAIAKLKSPQEIYRYVIDTLSYFNDVDKQTINRLGAQKALEFPNVAVCTEFTDLFVAISREKGVYAREIEGYGYSEKENIRPQSLNLDAMHAWPEYYDESQHLWVPIDPTWEDTSGIDYFSGFDTNHIALAIHGQNSQYPLPAGFYKSATGKDVRISIAKKPIQEYANIRIDNALPSLIFSGKTYTQKITITNTGNTFLNELSIVPKSESVLFDSGVITVDFLAPFESREVSITFHAEADHSGSDIISFTYDGAVISQHSLEIQTRARTAVFYLAGASLAAGIITLIYFFLRRKRTEP